MKEFIRNETENILIEEELGSLVNEYKSEDSHIKFIKISDNQNKIIAHTDWRKVNETETDSADLAVNKTDKLISAILTDAEYGEVIETVYPLQIAGKKWGVMKVGFEAESLRTKLKDLYFMLFFSTLFVILGALTVLYFISARLTKALSELIEILERLDFDIDNVHSGAKETNEAQFLFAKFEEMRSRLHRSKEELINAQKQIYQAEKLASIGRLASGVAHEINNPLNGIRSCLYSIEKNPENILQNKEYLELIDEGITNIELIVKKLLGFARQKGQSVEEVNVNQNIKKVLSLLDYKISEKNVEIIEKLDTSEPTLKADAQLLQEVLMNIILNALDAVSERGKIEIETRSENGKIVIEITDDGEGMEKEDIEKIFDPFYTTKEPGKGTGLGLSVSLGIIDNFGGTIEVESKKGNGATFKITIPE
jgi:signal transduction histidine kinase